MQKQFCGVHVDEEEKYLCIHPSCIKEKENKLLCGQCFDKHAQDRTEFHQKVSYYILLEKAQSNKEAFTKLQENNIDRIQSIFEEFKKQLILLVEQTRTWQINQLKLLEDSTGTQIKKFQEELTKASVHYKLDQLDNQIYFYLLDYPEQKRLSEESFKNTQRFINQKMKDYQQLIELQTQKNWNLQNVFQTSQGEYCLPKTTQQDITFDICKEHKEKKNQLYINQQIKRSEIGQLSCTKCLIKKTLFIDISSIRNVSDLINEEKEKIAIQKEQMLNFQQNLTTLVDEKLILIENKQKEYYEYFESLKKIILYIENQAIQKLMTTPECDFIFWGIDYNKLFLSHGDIQRKFKNDMKGVEDKIKPISIAIERPADLFFSILLEKTYNQQANEISDLVQKQNQQAKKISELEEKNNKNINKISQLDMINNQQAQTINFYELTNNQQANAIYQYEQIQNQLAEQISSIEQTNNQYAEKISLMEKTKNQQADEISQLKNTKNQQADEISQLKLLCNRQTQTIQSYELTCHQQKNKIIQMEKISDQQTEKINQMEIMNNLQAEKIVNFEQKFNPKVPSQRPQRPIQLQQAERISYPWESVKNSTLSQNQLDQKQNLEKQQTGREQSPYQRNKRYY